jgi:two-component system, NtrC family, sensor histidine kinase HydH
MTPSHHDSTSETRFSLGPLGGGLGRVEIELSDLIEHTGDAVILIDRENTIRYWNRGAETMFQYRRDEVLGRRIGFLLPADLLAGGELESLQRRIDVAGSVSNFLTRRVRKDGVERWVSLTRSVLHDTAGNVIGSTAVFRDVTEDRMLQQELASARATAVLGEMAVTLAHRIKNGLAGIYGAVQVLSRDIPTSDPRRDVYEEVRREVERLDETARDLLRYAAPGPIRREETDVRTLLDRTVDMLERAPAIRRHEIEIRVPAGLVVELDPGSIAQALHCIVLNAAEAMERPGRISITARGSGNAAEIEVLDDGPGIPAAVRPTMFQPFFTTKSQGTGLGLSIARKNVEAHGGTILVESPEDGGARITIRVPLGAPEVRRQTAHGTT